MHGRWVVRLPTWLGDTVMAVPTIRALARGVDELTVWGAADQCQLLQATGVRTNIMPWSQRPGIAAFGDILRGARSLADIRTDGVVLLPNSFAAALPAAIARIRRRVGYATDGRSLLLTDALPRPKSLERQHDGGRYAHLLSALDLPSPQPEDVLLEMPRAAVQRAKERLDRSAPLLALVPGCANGPAKRWPTDSYAALADRAAELWGAVAVIVGGPGDRSVADEVESYCKRPCINLAGRTDPVELAAVLQACRAVVSNDTGAAHLAAALSTPTLVLFGPTDPHRTRARGPHVRIASIGAFCQPCLANICPLDHRCMTGLTAELVISALAPLWEGTLNSAPS